LLRRLHEPGGDGRDLYEVLPIDPETQNFFPESEHLVNGVSCTNCHSPHGSKDVTFRAGWNYYQYGEASFLGPTAPRYFHANNTTLALRYAF
jgi:hypothetical protein